MTSANDLSRLVPGFDFLQGLMKGGGTGLPGIGQWIAPTLEPAELQKRIDELRTVQFWLEQNAKLIGTTIQALEVQRMTLATLEGMNLQMADLADSLKLRPAEPGAAPAPDALAAAGFPAAAAPAAPADSAARSRATAPPAAKAGGAAKGARAAPAAAVDPMQWWGALTQQFTELATKALQGGGAEVARSFAGAAAQQGAGDAATSIERMMAMSGKAADLAAKGGAAMAGAMGAAGAAAAASKASKTRAGRAGSAASAGAGRAGAARRRQG